MPEAHLALRQANNNQVKWADNVLSPHLKTPEIKVYLPAETNTPKPRGTHDHQHATDNIVCVGLNYRFSK